MNRVGAKGRGESTWLGFFLHAVLTAFAPICDRRGRSRARRSLPRRRRSDSRGALERAWDGEWYRRGYYDDGTPLGSAQNDECRIDSIAQSWAVLSGAVPLRFAERAMDGVRTFLIARGAQVLLLLHPPFDASAQDPGLHQGVSAGRSRERRAVHARGRVDRDGAGAARQRRRGGRSVPHAQSRQPRADSRRRRALPDRAVRARRRRLQPSGASRTRRVELVHRIGRLDVSRRRREHPRPAPPRRRRSPSIRAFRRRGRRIRSSGVPTRPLRHRGVEPRAALSRRAAATLDGAAVDHLAIPLVDDGQAHVVQIVLGAVGAGRAIAALSRETPSERRDPVVSASAPQSPG